MTIEDPVADMLTRIKNANERFHNQVTVPRSNLKLAIAKILKEEGYIKDYGERSQDSKQDILIQLKYKRKSGERGKGRRKQVRVIEGIERVSKPATRVYTQADEIPEVLSGLGTCVLSTSSGVMTGKEARKRGVGGEVLFKIW